MSVRHLFNKVDWFSFAEFARQALKQKVSTFPETKLKSDGNAAVEQLRTSSRIQVPTVSWENVETSSREADVDIAGVPNTMAYFTGQHEWRKGIQFVVKVPFQGDAKLFDVQPPTYSLNPPFADVDGEVLVFTYSGLQANVEAWTSSFEESKKLIEQNLMTLRESAEKLNQELNSIIDRDLQARRYRLEQASADLEAFRARLKGGKK